MSHDWLTARWRPERGVANLCAPCALPRCWQSLCCAHQTCPLRPGSALRPACPASVQNTHLLKAWNTLQHAPLTPAQHHCGELLCMPTWLGRLMLGLEAWHKQKIMWQDTQGSQAPQACGRGRHPTWDPQCVPWQGSAGKVRLKLTLMNCCRETSTFICARRAGVSAWACGKAA